MIQHTHTVVYTVIVYIAECALYFVKTKLVSDDYDQIAFDHTVILILIAVLEEVYKITVLIIKIEQ